MSAGEIGALVGGRSLLAVFLSIHVGVLMDRFGTRPETWPPLVLQIVNGGALSFAWSGLADPDRPADRG